MTKKNQQSIIDSMEGVSGLGMETVDPTQDLALSRIAIAHKLSPQVDEEQGAYIEGLKSGDLFDATLGENLGDSVEFIPVSYRKRWVEWGERSSQAGIVQVHSTPDILDKCQPGARRDPKMRFMSNGNEIRETAYFFGWLLEENGNRRDCYIAMSSTQLRKARAWMTLAKSELLEKSDGSQMVAPLFYRVYILSPRRETNAQGTWYGFNIQRSEKTIQDVAHKHLPLSDIVNEAKAINEAMDEHPLLVSGAINNNPKIGTGSEEAM